MDGSDKVDSSQEGAEHKVGGVWEDIDGEESNVGQPTSETEWTDVVDKQELREAQDTAVAELIDEEMQHGESKKMSRTGVIKRFFEVLKGKVGGVVKQIGADYKQRNEIMSEVSREPFQEFASSTKTNIENAARAFAYATINLISTKEDEDRPDSLPFGGENLHKNKLLKKLEEAYVKLAFADGDEKKDFLKRIAQEKNPTPDVPSWLRNTSEALSSLRTVEGTEDDENTGDAKKEYERYKLIAKAFPYALQILISSGKTGFGLTKAYMKTLKNMVNYNKEKVEKVAEKSPLNQ
ncbi:hypothetical protein KBG23_02335 [Candidatus Dojkabacteria bacterium]|jgi:hypothetical protein|nr:hypothetical protein [Candidatus Dojkabacteria bacterium]